MAVVQASSQEHVPAWKRLGLKLKNSQATGETSSSLTAGKTIVDTKPKKRKATDISGASNVSHDQSPRSEGTKSKTDTSDRPLKRKKSVAFADGTKAEDGDANENLLEDYVAQQNGGEDQFSKSEVAQFTVPAKVHPAKTNGASKADSKEPKKGKERQKERTPKNDTKDQPQQDPSYITYLKGYRSSRASWKFNKTQQIKLLNNLYNTYRIPFELDDALSSYLSGLQGEAARKRLAEAAEKIITGTDDLEGADAIMPGQVNLKEAREKALKAQLKQTKSILRNQEAAEQAYSDEHQEKLRKRKRAVLVLQSLQAYASPSSGNNDPMMATQIDDSVNGVGQPTKKRKTRRSRKMRTGVPDDDDTDETSSMSSVPSSTTSSSSSSSSDEDEDGSSDEEGSGSKPDSADSSSDENIGSSDGSSDARGNSLTGL